jgi:hypothetical protein
MLLNVLDFPPDANGDRFQAALEAASHGDRIYLPGYAPYVAPPGGWKIKKSVEIFGDGPGNPADGILGGTVLNPNAGSTGPVLELVPEYVPDPNHPDLTELGRVYIHDLQIKPPGAARDGGDGIYFQSIDGKQKLSDLRLERLSMRLLRGNGISLSGGASDAGSVTNILIQNCSVDSCDLIGIHLLNASAALLIGSSSTKNGRHALLADVGGELAMYGCHFGGKPSNLIQASVELASLSQVRVDGCTFRDYYSANNNIAGLRVVDIAGSTVISGCTFEIIEALSPQTSGTIGILLEVLLNPRSGPVSILVNQFANVATAIRASDSRLHGILVLPQFARSYLTNPVIV